MNTINATNAVSPMNAPAMPHMTEKLGRTTFEVYVHFSQTSKETMTDKVMRLIRNDLSRKDML